MSIHHLQLRNFPLQIHLYRERNFRVLLHILHGSIHRHHSYLDKHFLHHTIRKQVPLLRKNEIQQPTLALGRRLGEIQKAPSQSGTNLPLQ